MLVTVALVYANALADQVSFQEVGGNVGRDAINRGKSNGHVVSESFKGTKRIYRARISGEAVKSRVNNGPEGKYHRFRSMYTSLMY